MCTAKKIFFLFFLHGIISAIVVKKKYLNIFLNRFIAILHDFSGLFFTRRQSVAIVGGLFNFQTTLITLFNCNTLNFGGTIKRLVFHKTVR